MSEFDHEMDATGLNCPLPILRAKKALARMEKGQVLRVLTTDPSSVRDFDAFACNTGNRLIESSEDGGTFRFLLEKG